MARTVNENLKDAGRAVSDTAKNVGEKIVEGAEKATRAVKEMTGMGGPAEGADMGTSGIREHMKVIASCGKTVGVVDHVESGSIKLTRKDSPDGQHHFIPFNWIERVDSHVHLSKNSMETERDWKSDAASCGPSCGCNS